MRNKRILSTTLYGFLMYFIGLSDGLSRQPLMWIFLFLIIIGGVNIYIYFIENKSHLKG